MIKKILFPVCIIILQITYLYSQESPTARIGVSTTGGCEPLTVDFQDQSTAGSSEIVSYTWSFDDDNNSSTEQNPSYTYDQPGDYYVILEIKDANGLGDKIGFDISVSSQPVINYISANKRISIVTPFEVDFSASASSPSGNTISEYSWDFGDGESSTAQNPTHTYNDYGSFDVGLTVTDDAGCSNELVNNDYIKINELKAIIEGPDTVCIDAPFTLQNASTGATICLWKRGGETLASNCDDLNLIDTVAGNHQVTLTVYSSTGVSTDTTFNYYVEDPFANFSMDTTKTCSYPIPVAFTDRSISTVKEWEWDFGDGETSTEQNPNHTYTQEPETGIIFPVKLSITTYTGCTADTTFTFKDMHPDIIMDIDTSGCIPLPVTISDLTDWENDTSYFTTPEKRIFKIFYPNSLTNIFDSEEHNPDPDNMQKLFDKPGRYPTRLVIWDDVCGWDSSSMQTILVGDTLRIRIDTTVFGTPLIDGNNLCVTNKNNYRFIITNNDTIRAEEMEAKWFFPYLDTIIDDDIETDTSGNIDHNFYNPEPTTIPINTKPGKDGDFSPYYKTISSIPDSMAGKTIDVGVTLQHNECYYDTVYKPVKLHGPIANVEDVRFDCTDPLTYTFEGKFDTNEDYQGEWEYYDLSNGYDHTHASEQGTFTTDYYYTEALTEDNIYVEKVQLRGYSSISGCEHVVSYMRSSGASMDTVDYFVHQDENTYFNYDEKICWDDALQLSADTNTNIVEYLWHIERDGQQVHPVILPPPYSTPYWDAILAPSGSDLNKTYNQRGEYSVDLRVIKKNFCIEDASNTIKAYKPYVDFIVNDTAGCMDSLYVTFDTVDANVTPDTNYVQWKWTFDTQGVVTDTETNNAPNQVNYTYAPQNPSFFTPQLEITDELGCVASKSKNQYILVTKPMPNFWADTNVCEQQEFVFHNTSDSLGSSLTYLWHFGDGNTSSAYSPTHKYTGIGDYTIKLHAQDDFGCVDSLIKDDYIHTQNLPDAKFTAIDAFSPCHPFIGSFIENSDAKGDTIVEYHWIYGNGNERIFQTRRDTFINNYKLPGFYDVELRITTQYGCKDSLKKENYVEVGGPYAEFHIERPRDLPLNKACKSDTIKFVIDTMIKGSFSKYIWHYDVNKPNGTDRKNSTDTITGIPETADHNDLLPGKYSYPGTGTRYIYLEMIGEGNCFSYYPLDLQVRESYDSIEIVPLTAEFQQGDSACGFNAPVQFNMIDSVLPVEWKWTFGDGSFDTETLNPLHVYQDTGEYIAKLFVKGGIYGCVDTVKQTIKVFSNPYSNLRPQDTLICDYDTVYLHTFDTTAYSYAWNSQGHLVSSAQATAKASPDETADYYVTVTDDYTTCTTIDTSVIFVQKRPDATFYYVDPMKDTVQTEGEIFVPLGDTLDFFVVPNQPKVDVVWQDLDTTQEYFTPYNSRDYTLYLKDSLKCYNIPRILNIIVSDGSLDVPTAFTPNGDGINDVIKFDGWGLGELLDFRIFNRWGQQLFQTQDMNTGWDGTFNGKKQPIDTYVYKVKIKTLKGNTITKQGTFTLMR